ncbi:hypothetical protein [Polyangium jinanense]|uniref:Uncharacterized protein n=1 Tax=Polyangium jinanense TaxID=2829994 RepID=A0A9X3WWU3_9BACT|nr:hypothetical protein [Polyangium jinanense]MDC3953172.1 hypothetical protein [Polyangium jinanense]MDC3979707.1 hypothetical protein [Polyangium jinanense]
METIKPEFLANLASELEAAGKPMSAPATTSYKRRLRAKKSCIAAIFALVGPLLVVSPSPAAAACDDPNFVRRTHATRCGEQAVYHRYLRTEWDSPGFCHVFRSMRVIRPGQPGQRVDLGEKRACGRSP